MEKVFRTFHYVSFLQYPFMAIALYYCYAPLFKGLDNFDLDSLIESFNLGLLFMGIALSFTSLADIRKRTKLGDKVFGKEKRARNWLIYVSCLVLATFCLAIICRFFLNNEKFENLAIGIFVFGIGLLGLLRMNIEIIKSYQKDWN